jgi:hypothetical protein
MMGVFHIFAQTKPGITPKRGARTEASQAKASLTHPDT